MVATNKTAPIPATKAPPIRSDALLPSTDFISSQVLMVRGQRVLLAQQLAALYDVETKVLNQAVKRNVERFPADFMFQLDASEIASLRSQFVTLEATGFVLTESLRSQFVTVSAGSHAKYLPYAFTEQGIAMLSSVLNSDRAVAVNIEIMRTFIKLRGMLSEHVDLKRKLAAMERKYDDNFKVVFEAIRELMTPPASPKKRRIGFIQDEK
jgi:ORF6N domain